MRKSDFIGLVLLAFVVGCRVSVPVADFYAVRCYPGISHGLSWCASFVPFSLEEVIVIGFGLAFVRVLVRAVRRKEGFGRWLGKTLRVAMWLVVWFYMGWGNNYFRTPLYPRMGIRQTAFEREAFCRFLTDYTETLNECAANAAATHATETTPTETNTPIETDTHTTATTTATTTAPIPLEADIRIFYSEQVTPYGYTALREWQRVKRPLVNRLYSAVGVLGFMGPFFCESQLNLDLPELEYPFTLAHEMAHLAGVTSEAEANYWAYVFCRQSEDAAVRYSGYIGLLDYAAANASALLPDDAFEAWTETLSPDVRQAHHDIHAYWQGKRVNVFDAVQRRLMDLLLKSNHVSEGARDYFGVIGMIMTMDAS